MIGVSWKERGLDTMPTKTTDFRRVFTSSLTCKKEQPANKEVNIDSNARQRNRIKEEKALFIPVARILVTL